MIIKEIFYGLKCNRCGTTFSDGEHEFWSDEDSAIEYAYDSDWIEEKGKHYCVSCHEHNEEKDENVPFPEFPKHLKELDKFLKNINGWDRVINESSDDMFIISKRLYDRDNLLSFEEDYIKGLMGEKFISLEYLKAESYSKQTLLIKIKA